MANGAERESAAAEWTRLEALVRDLLGASLTVDLNQEPNLFGRPIPECKLSEGQCMLLQTAVLLHAQSTKLEDLVLLVDEPECHLHPSAVVDAVQRIRDASRLGQIWIATHSVPLLATVPPESIWFVHDGEASWAGRRTESVLDGLLGGSEGREQIAEFLRLPAQLASIRFAAQCLIPPGTVNTGPDDPQAAQLRDYCQSRAPVGDGVLRVLDYGAGKGRLLSAMVERWTDARPFADAVDYRAFEPRAATELDDLVGSIFGENGMQRVFRSQVELSMLDQHSFDVVVMCNVLHEVPPEQWKHLFGSAGCMTRLLKPSGAVLILEDMQLPHGERAHRHGFLLLDTPQLHILTACTEADGARIQTRDVNDGRLKAHAVPAQLLGRTTTETAKAALACLQEQAREEVLSLRDKDPDSRNGHMHALWTQLLANADLGQRSL
ncbi:MAG: AAA family ATPase [Polyangiaceae bacterium]|nr:AAA family ATPase [Polyangiaceae bacterium]